MKAVRIRSLDDNLKRLRLPTIRELYPQAAKQAEKEVMPYRQFLCELIEREVEQRKANRVQKLLKESGLPLEKSLDQFEADRLGLRAQMQMKTLLEGDFLDRRENILAFGNPGSGKTHFLCAIAQDLIHKGRRIYFSTCQLLVQDLLRAKQSLKLKSAIKKLFKRAREGLPEDGKAFGFFLGDGGNSNRGEDHRKTVPPVLAENLVPSEEAAGAYTDLAEANAKVRTP